MTQKRRLELLELEYDTIMKEADYIASNVPDQKLDRLGWIEREYTRIAKKINPPCMECGGHRVTCQYH